MIKQSILTNPKYEPKRFVGNGGVRYYGWGDTRFPSITTVLGCRDKGWLERWIANVGPDKSAAVSRKASSIGNGLHLACEYYLANNEKALIKHLMKSMPEVKLRFKNFKSFFDKITEVFLSEGALASTIIGIGGTVDAFVMYDGRPTIVDFKTSNRLKLAEDIKNYFAQATFYAYAVAEQYGIPVPRIVIAIAVDGIIEPQIFETEASKHIEYLIESLRMYNNGESD